ncbi:heavy-metal-associated domain-containing protein [uncultured Friedmanniella sp.]|uniref:heavy-metal-associated domain-containing protein n=1 Tax=uncultured Friedmanniella sp. TaxID=335381 RepID=UPI0035CC133D
MSSEDLPVRHAEYRVQGMTCQHCVSAVTAEVEAVSGVTGVQVDLSRGLLRVTSGPEVSRTAVASAVDEAGYALVED